MHLTALFVYLKIVSLQHSVQFLAISGIQTYPQFEERNSMNQNYCVYIILVAKLLPLNVVFDKTSNSLLDSWGISYSKRKC